MSFTAIPPPPSEESLRAHSDALSMRSCNKCGAEFRIGLRRCPACGMAQSGRPRGAKDVLHSSAPSSAPENGAVPAPPEISKSNALEGNSVPAATPVPTDSQGASALQPVGMPGDVHTSEPAPAAGKAPSNEELVSQALADTAHIITEDIIAPVILPRNIQAPKLDDIVADRMAAAWTPLIAPYISGPALMILLALIITFQGFSSYTKECLRLAREQKKQHGKNTVQ